MNDDEDENEKKDDDEDDDAEDNDEMEVSSEDTELGDHEPAVLRYRTKFMRWGLAGAGGETMNGKASSYNLSEKVLLQFLQTLETGDPLSYARQQCILDNARRMGGQALLLPRDIHEHWYFVENAHERLHKVVGDVKLKFPFRWKYSNYWARKLRQRLYLAVKT
jgi:hypothetical protein